MKYTASLRAVLGTIYSAKNIWRRKSLTSSVSKYLWYLGSCWKAATRVDITSPPSTHQQPTNDLTDDDKDEEESGHTSYYVEHDADVVGKLFRVFDVGYQNRRDQKPNCNSKLCRRQTQPISYQMAKSQEPNLETTIRKHHFLGWGDGSVGKGPGIQA